MKSVLFFVFLVFAACEGQGLKTYSGVERQCFNCLCHARTGCFSRFNCASYSVSFDYWKKAKSPVVNNDDVPESQDGFRKCMKNEDCILTTIDQYADAIGHIDCNCDGRFDCKDRFAIHLFGEECTNPNFSQKYARRFNTCSKQLGVGLMLPEEGFDGCAPEVF